MVIGPPMEPCCRGLEIQPLTTGGEVITTKTRTSRFFGFEEAQERRLPEINLGSPPHLYAGQWSQACPGLERKRPDLPWHRVLGDEPEEEWRGEIDQVFFGARPLENEVVFFHRSSRTLLCADAIFNLANHPSLLTRVVARLISNRKPGAMLLDRVLIRDRASAREQLDRMLAWDIDRIVLAHGGIIETGGRGCCGARMRGCDGRGDAETSAAQLPASGTPTAVYYRQRLTGCITSWKKFQCTKNGGNLLVIRLSVGSRCS